MRRLRTVLISGGVALFLLGACDVSGLVDVGSTLLAPQAALLDTPGRQLASGSYRDLFVDGSVESGGTVLARRLDTEEPSIVIVPYKDGKTCEISPAYGVDRLSSRVDVELPGLLSVREAVSDSGPGTIGFFTFDCKRKLPSLVETFPPRDLFPFPNPTGALALSANGDLSFIDVVQETSTIVATEVDAFSTSVDRLWTLENGTLLVRDGDFQFLDQLGEGVESYFPTGGEQISLVYQDSEGLHVYGEARGDQLISKTACRAHYLGADTVSFHDPCDARRLNILTNPRRVTKATTKSADSDMVVVVGPDNVLLDSLRVEFGEGKRPSEFVLLRTAALDTPSGTLHVGYLNPSEAATDGRLNLNTTQLGKNVQLVGGNYYRDYADGAGTLVDLERDETNQIIGLRKLADGVVQIPGGAPFSIRGVLSDFNGKDGRLVRLALDEAGKVEATTVARHVPYQNQLIDDTGELIAFVAEVDGDNVGTLVLADSDKTYVISKGVMLDTVRFLDDPFGLIYLRKNDVDGSGTLRVYLIDPGIDLVVHNTVSEYRAIPWPSPGVLYAVPEGKDQGLWFAKAR